MKRLFALLTLLLAGCSSPPSLPDFTASGYLADRGAVRIWRKNHQHSVHMLVVFKPFQNGATVFTRYGWLDGNLTSIERHPDGAQPDNVTLRFDGDGGLNFMQRQLAGRREAVSEQTIELYKFDAQRMLKISDALLAGHVLLKQGRWQGNDVLQTCQGEQIKPALDKSEWQRIEQLQHQTGSAVSVAWLEAPAGTQLLDVSTQDDCQWEPQEADF
ncbi:hypothetical protein COO59_19470 [Mixta theicola]|uniref:DUF1481 domain-containing protein n=1 Tax=Mixta theicola TaxID=1458355 RepID=A0A2K1Q4S0_9GAMM|nr:DUF1481 domain-containing protein [Mixta theicola]PNS10039.1 hypothetical protein COO59_19470 [Mixta theicola]GLR09008.1 membrane protein [Mixta theicola]